MADKKTTERLNEMQRRQEELERQVAMLGLQKKLDDALRRIARLEAASSSES